MVVGTGSPSADLVAQVLNSNGISATWVSRVGTPNLRLIRKFDVVYGIYLQTSSRYILAGKLLGKQTIVHFVGSDEYRVMRERTLVKQMFWRTVLRCTDAVLYVSPHLEPMVGRGLHTPISNSYRRVQTPRTSEYFTGTGHIVLLPKRAHK